MSITAVSSFALFTLVLGALAKDAATNTGDLTSETLARTPAMAWNSWNKFACNISEELIKEITDAMLANGLLDLGYQYVNIDDCWQAAEREKGTGRILADPIRFPSGMKALADYVHGKGFKFGIYSSAGFKTCQGYPASLGLEELDAKTYAEWGVDYLKYDNCYTDHGAPQQRYPPMGEALKKSGREIYYSLCEWGRENPAVWAPEISQSWRISGDIRDDWSSIITRTDINAPLWRYSGPGRWNDPDMLEVGNGKCTMEEYKSHFSLWAMMKSPLVLGNDIRELSSGDEVMEIVGNKEVIAVNQDSLGRQARRVWSDIPSVTGERLIAVKCASGEEGVYEDDPLDQQWLVQLDGTIVNPASGRCLSEVSLAEVANGKANSTTFIDSGDLSSLTPFAVATVSAEECLSKATRWDTEQYVGGSIVSRSTGRCLEVAKIEPVPLIQGKRIQTGPCLSVNEKQYVDVREHQSWTNPNGRLRNLYQRQCLTVNRDAPPGVSEEVWAVQVESSSSSVYDTVVLLFNKGHTAREMTATWAMLGLPEGQRVRVRDLWLHQDRALPAVEEVRAIVPSHGVVMLRLSLA